MKKLFKNIKDLTYKEYRLKRYLENEELSKQTVKLRLVSIGNELREKRKLLNIGTQYMADLIYFNGFKCTESQILSVEKGEGYNVGLLVKYTDVIRNLFNEQGKKVTFNFFN